MNRPQKGEVVLAKIKEIRQHSVLAELIEYPGQEAMIHISEIASGWVKNIRNHVKPGQVVVAKVTFLSKSTIGLSIKRTSEREKKEKIKQFNLAKRAEKIFEFMKEKGLSENDKKKIIDEFGSLWACFETAVKKPEMVERRLPDIADTIIEVSQKNIKKKVVDFRYEISISSTEPDGIEIIKKALAPLEKKYDISYITAGKFLLHAHSDNPKEMERKLVSDMEKAKKGKKYTFEYARV